MLNLQKLAQKEKKDEQERILPGSRESIFYKLNRYFFQPTPYQKQIR
jgi:hypothetical protein